MKKLVLTSIVSCFLGFIIGSIVTKFMTETSPYEFLTQWITDILDKPFIQTHGICILVLSALSFITHHTIQSYASLNSKHLQDILQTNEKNSAKILHEFSKIAKMRE